MKIGILTFHYTTNQGSIMQTYCLYNLIQEKYPSAEVQIINLIPYTREFYELLFLKKKFPLFDIKKLRKYLKLRKFVRTNFNLSKRVYFGSIPKQVEYINKQNFDFVITGSDTVWFKSKKLRNRIPNIYFLPEGIKAEKVSFAVSVDPLNDIGYYLSKKNDLLKIFNSYKLITIRDRVTQNLVTKIGFHDSKLVTDPTLIYPFEQKLKLKVSKKDKPEIKKIGIGVADKQLTVKIINALAHIGNYEIFNFFDCDNKKTDYLIDELNSYYKFDAIITDRFHRTIFSLKLSRSLTIYIENLKFNKHQNSKGRDLLTRIGLEECIVSNKDDELTSQLKFLISSWSLLKQHNQNCLISDFISQNQINITQLFNKTFNESPSYNQ